MENTVNNLGKRVKKYIDVLFARDISLTKYIYYNYFCKNIVRQGKNKIVPYKNSVLDLSKNARIYLSGTNNIVLGYNKLKNSKVKPMCVWREMRSGIVETGLIYFTIRYWK